MVAANALLPLSSKGDDEQGWSAVAAPTSWTAARTVEHVVDALLFYAGQVARRADRRLPVLRDGRAAPQRTARQRADRSAPADRTTTRPGHGTGVAPQWHPSGTPAAPQRHPSGSADAAGWAGMAHVHGKEVQSGASYAVTCRTRTNLDVGRTGVPVSGSACGDRRRRLRLVLCAGGRSACGMSGQTRRTYWLHPCTRSNVPRICSSSCSQAWKCLTRGMRGKVGVTAVCISSGDEAYTWRYRN